MVVEQFLLDRADADTRVEFDMVEAEFAQCTQWRGSAEMVRAIGATMREAVEHPEVFVIPGMAPKTQLELAILEGVGPIDIETAHRLCATAPSITRLVTDPVTGSVLQMDPHECRLPAAVKRWLAIHQLTCDFPDCGRRASQRDLDH